MWSGLDLDDGKLNLFCVQCVEWEWVSELLRRRRKAGHTHFFQMTFCRRGGRGRGRHTPTIVCLSLLPLWWAGAVSLLWAPICRVVCLPCLCLQLCLLLLCSFPPLLISHLPPPTHFSLHCKLPPFLFFRHALPRQLGEERWAGRAVQCG